MIDPSKKARIIWSCRRGMLELDLILKRFSDRELDKMTANDLETFEKLLDYSDPQLLSWLMGHEKPVNKELAKIVDFIELQNRAG